MSLPPTPQWRVRQVVKTIEAIAAVLTITDQTQIEALLSHAAGLTRVAEALTPVLRPDALTPQQSRVLAYVRDHIVQHGQAPTRKEIATAFSFASANAAQEHLRALERKGWLTFTGGGPRGIRVNKRPSTLSTMRI